MKIHINIRIPANHYFIHSLQHVALCLAAMVVSTTSNVKEWSKKTLKQIQIIGKELYGDAVLDTKTKQITLAQLSDILYIQDAEYKVEILSDNGDLDLETLPDTLSKLFESSSMLYILIGDNSMSLFSNEDFFYAYEPNGIDDKNKEIRPSVSCFTTFDSLISHIWQLCTIVENTTYSVKVVEVSQINHEE